MVDRQPEVTVLIPARNESATITTVIDRALAVLGQDSEIVVVDDGSTDGTAEVVRGRSGSGVPVRLIRRERPGGKGTAVRDGIALCRGRYIVFQDADLELDPAAYPQLLAPLRAGRAALVNGSRFSRGRGLAPRRTALANWILTSIANAIYGTRLTDLCSGHKALTVELLRSLPLRSRTYELESEIVGLVAKRGLRIEEVPTEYRPRTRREGKRIGLRDGLVMLRSIVATRLRG